MPMPEDEASWANLQIVFATKSGNIRRNELSDFVDIRRSGKIAMKLDEGDQIIGVEICNDVSDVMLTTSLGQCIRFDVNDVRIFKGRDSTGVRGIRLADDDFVISMAVLRHVEASPAERLAYIKLRRAMGGEEAEPLAAAEADEDVAEEASLSQERYAELSALEQFILTVSINGYGKRTSSYEYRVTGRGGKGITAMTVSKRNGPLVASFPIEEGDQIMLVSDGGQLIRCPVHDIRAAGRSTQGVTIFDTAEDEHVVSVECIKEEDAGGDENGDVGGEGEAAS